MKDKDKDRKELREIARAYVSSKFFEFSDEDLFVGFRQSYDQDVIPSIDDIYVLEDEENSYEYWA